jgi:hypothetical protein
MVNLVKARHILSLKYDIAADDLDESIVPLMIGISKISDELEKSLVSYDLQVKNIEKLMNQKVPQIYCDKPKTALLVGVGKYGSISLAVFIFLSVFWIGLVVLKTTERKYGHLEKLSEIIRYDAKINAYFVNKRDYKKINDGIILKTNVIVNGK